MSKKDQVRRVSIDCSGLDKPRMLRALADALSFEEHFGANFDALYDSLADNLQEHGALELELTNWSGLRMAKHNRETLLSIFEDMQEELEPGMLKVKIVERVIG
jgi:RNAse (barnase) inhibitor barstar